MPWSAPSHLTDAYATAVLADTPKGYWHLDWLNSAAVTAAAGAVSAVDSSGLAHDLTVNGGATIVTGARSLAVDLDGSTGYMTATDHADLDLTDTFTLEAWVTGAPTGGNQTIFDKGVGAYLLRLQSTGALALAKNGTAVIVASTIVVPNDGALHHVVATKSGATVKLYIDGVDRTGTVTNQTCANTATDLYVGRLSAGGEFFNGIIDEPAVYATALSSARVSAHFSAAATGALSSSAFNRDADNLQYLYNANSLGLFTPGDSLDAVCHPTLNGAIMAPAMCVAPVTVSKIAWRTNTSNGQVDVGIYTDNGDGQTISMVRTSGLTAMPGGSGAASVNLSSSVTLTPYVKYWLVMGFTNTNAAIMGSDGPVQTICKKAVNCVPLLSTVSFNSPAPSASPCLAALP